jgi:AhpD family alkylhydroperoxidase
MMNQRLDFSTISPEAIRPLFEANKVLARSGLEPALLIWVSLRASQINGCAFCIAMHSREAVELGESGDRLWGLPAWREASWYSERERAALEWTEALTRIAGREVSDELYARVRGQFNDKEMVALTLAVNAINDWNRYNIAFRTPPERADAVIAQLRPMHAAT